MQVQLQMHQQKYKYKYNINIQMQMHQHKYKYKYNIQCANQFTAHPGNVIFFDILIFIFILLTLNGEQTAPISEENKIQTEIKSKSWEK